MDFETFTSIEAGRVGTGSITHAGRAAGASTSTTRVGFCAGCAAETVFEQPGCLDGHGDLCSEWICTDCGLAVCISAGDYLEPVPIAPHLTDAAARVSAA